MDSPGRVECMLFSRIAERMGVAGSSHSGPDAAVMHPTNHRAQIDRVEQAVLASLERHGYPEAARFAVRLALEEALVNAFQHGHRGLPPEEPVTVSWEVGPAEVRISVEDHGPGFKPEAVPDCTEEDNLELPSGRGLMLIRSFMSSVTHDLGGRRLTMVYTRPQE
jgi:serine/threonine-protein kinase RsbW